MTPRIRNVIMLAIAGVIGIVVIALLSAPPKDDGDKQPGTALSPEHRPPGLTQPRTGSPDVGSLGVNEGTVIQVTDPKTGELSREFMWHQMTPQEQGVFDLVNPQARLHLEPWRVVHMRSDEGRFVAPGNHPQSGEFRKNVVVDIFQTDEGKRLDVSPDSPHRVIQIRLEQANFDTTLGELKSSERVEVTTPVTGQLSFRGRGLRLLYNELSRRVDYLEITEGEAIRYRPDPPKKPDAEQPTSQARTADDGTEIVEPPHYYRVEFDSQIKVQRGEQTIEAQKLVVFFAVEPHKSQDAEQERAQPAASAGIDHRGLASAAMQQVMRAMPLLMAQVGEVPAEPSQSNPVLRAGIIPGVTAAQPEQEVVLTWAGRMVMTPMDFPPPMIRVADDVYALFEGSPVRVSAGPAEIAAEAGEATKTPSGAGGGGGGGGEQLLCRSLEFTQPAGGAGEVIATGSDAYPLLISSPQMRATADRFVANLGDGAARLIGPGTLRGPDPRNTTADAPSDAQALPPDFKVAWSESVDLTFSDPKQPDGGIETARFIGQVQVEDPQFSLRSRELAVAFGVAEMQTQRQLKSLVATGAVVIDMEQANIAADRLEVETALDAEGRMTPSRMVAQGNVNVVDPQQQIASNALTVTLGPRTPEAPQRPAAAAQPLAATANAAAPAAPSLQDRLSLEVRTITAVGDVHLKREDTTMRGDRLEADAVTGSALLLGEPVVILHENAPDKQQPAQRPTTSELHVKNLRLTQNGKVAHADGPGRMIYTEADDPQAGYPGRRVNVTWTRSMNFDDGANLLQVAGDVVVESEDSPRELNRVKAHQMTLELIDAEALAKATGTPLPQPEAAGPSTTGKLRMDAPLAKRQLQRLIAQGDVEVLATRWTDQTRHKVEMRFLLTGPIVTFRHADQLAQVRGAGRMLLEEYSAAPLSAEAKGVRRMSGRGATVFTWRESLAMDRTRNDLTIVGNVQMTHNPQGSKEIVQLDCERLFADMETRGQLAATAMTKVESMSINAIDATGGVRIVADNGNDTVTADQMIYDGATQTVTLTAKPPERVTVTRASQVKPLTGQVIKWNLDTGRYEIVDAGL